MIINANTRLLLDAKSLAGVKRVAIRVTEDLEKVFGLKNPLALSRNEAGDNYIIVATVGYSDILSGVDFSDIANKREVYRYMLIDGHLAIVGSDKRGTIYGLFHLSELIGVSALVDWFKLYPARKKEVEIGEKELITSKEPSVRYRGFFINDEWPAFGNWCNKNFGGFNAKAYEEIFFLLLRLKGNYMWPAMWSAIFPEDGPQSLNEELADELGVVMGMSHHEPCLRQGEEYKYLRGQDSPYGDAWNFRTNRDGITRFWQDGLIRSGSFENVITVGMRGEADTAIMGMDATLKDNIDLLRDVLKTQNRLIRERVNTSLDKVPRMLALYKEVEPYFYGDGDTQGLMDDPELENVILMLCDDNYGNLRTVPTEHMLKHKGGYGMYYHFDYHGLPRSYEWVNSTYLPKIWEQMTQAYEFGIRELWIVNVGDLFTMEYPLAYFLELAYDYDKWGISNLCSASEYSRQFLTQSFGDRCDAETLDNMYRLLMGYTKIAHNRRPEAMDSNVYAPFMHWETEKLLRKIKSLEALSEDIRAKVDDDLKYPVFELMYYPARANLNIQKLWLYTGLNHAYAGFGALRAMYNAEEVEKCLRYDVELTDMLHEIDNGRWYGMGLSEHIGFKNWCEEECQYPVLHTFKSGNKQRVIVMIPGTNQHTEGGCWTRKRLILGEFLRPDKDKAYIDLLSAGAGADYEIRTEGDYIRINRIDNYTDDICPGSGKEVYSAGTNNSSACANKDAITGRIEGVDLQRIEIGIDRTQYDGSEGRIYIKSGDNTTEIIVPACFEMKSRLKTMYDKGTYIWMGKDIDASLSMRPYQYISIEANGYSEIISGSKVDAKAVFMEIPGYGRLTSAVKAFPVNESFNMDNAPGIGYSFEIKHEGNYIIEAYMNPSNAPYMDGHLYYAVSVDEGERVRIDALPQGFRVADGHPEWSKGVLDNIRKSRSRHQLKTGVHKVFFYALSPGFVLEKLVIFEEGDEPEYSYLGPDETYRV